MKKQLTTLSIWVLKGVTAVERLSLPEHLKKLPNQALIPGSF